MVNLTYWRANFEIAILFFDFFLVSESDTSGSFGTFLADIGGFFVNELANHFTGNLLLSFVFWRSIWPTREEFSYSLSFYCTVFGAKSNTSGRFGTSLAHIGVFFWISCQIDSAVMYFSPSSSFLDPYCLRFCGQFDLLEGKFCGRHPFLWLFSWFKGQFWHISSTYWRIFSEWVRKSL